MLVVKIQPSRLLPVVSQKLASFVDSRRGASDLWESKQSSNSNAMSAGGFRKNNVCRTVSRSFGSEFTMNPGAFKNSSSALVRP